MKPRLVATAGAAGGQDAGSGKGAARLADPAAPAAGGFASTPQSFHRPVSPSKCRVELDRHEIKRPFAKAMSCCTWGRCEQIAPRVHRSPRLLRAWENPSDPQLPPNQVLSEVIDAALAAGATEEEALSPLTHLAERYGRTLAHLDGRDSTEGEALGQSALALIESAADATAAFVRAIADRQVSGPELLSIEETAQTLINAVHLAVRRAQAAHGRGMNRD